MGCRLLSRLLIGVVLLQAYQTSPLPVDQQHKGSASKINPQGYTLNIQPFPDEDRFVGEVVIRAVWLGITNIITLNVHQNLTIDDTKVVCTKQSVPGQRPEIKVKKTERFDEIGQFDIVLRYAMNTGDEGEIQIKFSGKLNTYNTEGLFKASYVDPTSKQTKWVIASNLKPNFTSSVFPLFGDSTVRVPFDVSIERPSKLSSISTMPLLRSVDKGAGWTKDVFETTPPIIPWSLAILVSDLAPVNYNKPDIHIRIWEPQGLQDASKQNKSEIIYHTLNTLEEIYGVKYPLSKLDYVFLPDSGVNVYTSWGLVINSYNNLEPSGVNGKWPISYEMGYQWIGNLLTPICIEDDIATLALSDFTSLFYNAKNFGKEDPDLLQSWPISSIYANYYQFSDPKTTDDAGIRQISKLSKARMVYRMLTLTLSEQTFFGTLKNFIRKKQFKTFHMEEFWEDLTKQAHEDGTLPNDMTASKIARSWLDRYRLPLVTVTRNYNTNSALLTQSLFLRKRPRSAAIKDENLLWDIPIVLTNQDKLDFTNTKATYWMKDRELNVKNVAGSDQFIIVNPEEIATYMVNYDKKNWDMLAHFLQSAENRAKIPVMTRAKLIHDALNLAYAGALDFGTALNMTVHLKDETEYIPWKPFFVMFDHLGRHIVGTNAHKKYETYVGLLVKPLYERLLAKENKQDKQYRNFLNEVKGVLRNAGNDQLLKEANTAYQKWMNNPGKGYSAVESYLCAIFEFGTDEQWEFGLRTLMNLEGKPEIDRSYFYKCLVGCTSDSTKIKRVLNMTLFEQNNVFTDDDFNYACFMLTGGVGYVATFEYLKENFSTLKSRLEAKPEIWTQLVYTATNLYKTQEGLNQVSELYAKHRGEFGAAETTIQESLKKVKEEVQWSNDNLCTLEDWLDNYILKNSPQN